VGGKALAAGGGDPDLAHPARWLARHRGNSARPTRPNDVTNDKVNPDFHF